MAGETSTYELIISELGQALKGVVDDLGNPVTSPKATLYFLRKLGWNVPVDTDFSGSPISFINSLASINLDSPGDYLNLLESLKNIISEFDNIHNNLNLGAQFPDFGSEFPRQLLDYTIMRQLEFEHPKIFSFFILIGVFDNSYQPDSLPERIAYKQYRIEWDRLITFLQEPNTIAGTVYGWGTANLNNKLFIEAIEYLLTSLGVPIGEYTLANGVATKFNITEDAVYVPLVDHDDLKTGIEIYTLPTDGTPDNAGFAVSPFLLGTADTEIPINDFFTIILKSSVKVDKTTGVEIRPKTGIKLFDVNAASSIDGFFEVTLKISGEDKLLLIGADDSTRLEIGSIELTGKAQVAGSDEDFFIEIATKEGKIVLDMAGGDGFISTLLPPAPVEVPLDITIGYSTKSGIYFKGSAAIEIQLPVHLELGPVSVEGLTVSVKLADRKIPVSVGANIKGSLGPLVVVVENIGVTTNFSFPDNNRGNAGPFDLDFGFKPPNGVGLSVDAGIIKGGGFLYIDVDKGEYMGAMELDFVGIISLKAIAIINTKMPDGSNGFSLLIIITAEFPPIQLGFGFTLNAVGGLLGLNRTTKIDVLREGVKTNAIKSILFPQDIIANITRIVSDIKQVFPPFPDHFVVGPMAELGWGTPSILTLEIGILLEIPVPRIAILGVIKAVLPTDDLAILRIQVNFLGVIDFQNQYISFDASLYDSRLLIYTLSGDMAFRLSWGDNPMFILSVGGFHPAYHDAPQDLQHMTRLTISLLSGDNPRISVQTYFAVTSNTVQFGARAELYAEACGFNVYGFIGYDVLFQFDPFKFVADFSAGLALRDGDSVIMGISVSGELSGPIKWNAKGDASIDFFFFSISVSFNETWGDNDDETGPEKIDITTLLNAEINDDRNWKAVIPDYNNLHVSVKKMDLPPDKIVIHPFGVLTFSQRLVPLDISISKFGNKVPQDANRFEVKESDPGVTTDIAKEQFAPANFFDKSDNEKLSSPSFELMNSGFKVTGSSDLKMPIGISKSVDYELTYLHKKQSLLRRAGIYKFAKKLFKSSLKASAVSQSALSFAKNKISSNAPDAVLVPEDQFAIANVSDMKLHSAELVAGSYMEAKQQYEELISQNPALKDQVQILSHYELNLN